MSISRASWAVLLLTFCAVGCQTCPCQQPEQAPAKPAAATKASIGHPPIVHPIPVWGLGESRNITSATIKSAVIEGDRLRLTVEYTGTGKHHDITLLRDRHFKTSSPPQLDLYLNHTSTDSGGQPTREELHFDLAPIKAACLAEFKDAKALVLRIHDTSNDDIFVPLPRYEF